MITHAAVKIFDKRQNKEIIIPCHRHSDAYWILKEFGYKIPEYTTIAQGFLDEKGNFYNRIEAKQYAQKCYQVSTTEFNELYSEDLW